MGATVSTDVQRDITNVMNKAYNSCGTVSSATQADISGVTFNCLPNCPNPCTFEMDQTAAVEATCLIQNMQQGVAQVLSKQKAKTKAKWNLGWTISSNWKETDTNITNYLNNQCANASANVDAKITDTKITACGFKFVQGATAKQSCQINTIQNALANITSDQTSDVEGGGLSLPFLGGLIAIVVVVAIVGAVAGIIYKKKKGKKGKAKKKTKTASPTETAQEESPGTAETTETKETKETKETEEQDGGNGANDYSLLILGILGILFLFVLFIPSNGQKITNDDLSILNNKISEAQKIANQGPPTNVNYTNFALPDSRQESANPDPFEEPSLEDFYKPLI